MQQGKFAVAAAVFAEASRLSALDPQYPLMRGMALIEQASSINTSQSKQAENDRVATFNDAETSLKHAYELSGKKLAAAHLQLARVYEKRGQRDRAASELEQYLREAPDVTNADAIRQAIKKLRTSP
jgi:Tfp pilus assembly protein FimV